MAIIRLSKTRESTVFKAEEYKAAIRRYMESMGYSQTTDSFIEGHLADMVFFPPAGRARPPEVWVEAKATEVGLRDPDFVAEVRAYAREWLRRRPEARFSLKIFVDTMRKPAKWELVFGSAMTPQDVAEWLRTPLEEEEEDDLASPEARLEEVLSFFSETEVVEGGIDNLQRAADAKVRVGLAAADLRRKAQERLASIEVRANPVPRRSILRGNLLPLRCPREYLVLKVEKKSREDMAAALKGSPHAPFVVLSNDRVLTFKTNEAEREFSPLNARLAETVTLEGAEEMDASALIALLNAGVRRIMGRRGIGDSKGRGTVFYLRARDDVAAGEGRTIPTSDGKMLVAKPYYSSVEGDPEKRGPLNFVHHEGFTARVRQQWGGYFVQVGLHRVFTTDGATVIDGEAASKLDARFRTPEWNRSEAQLRKLTNLARYLFPASLRPLDGFAGPPLWMRELRVTSRFLSLPTNWSPEHVGMDQEFLAAFSEEDDDGDLR